jgi:S1-C subfamily serine protease
MNLDCAAGAFSVIGAGYYDQGGALLRQVTWTAAQIRTDRVTPGTPSEWISRRACALARAKETLKPQVVASLTDGNWRDLGADAARQATYFLKVDQIDLLKDPLLLAVVRIEYPAGNHTDQGVGYRTAVTLMVLGCRDANADVIKSDYYDSNGALVEQSHKEPGELKLVDIAANSPADRARAAACGIWRRDPSSVRAASGGGDRGGGEQTTGASSGTAWLTNKGYLVTAAHVVAGAKRILLAQDGRRVGAADVVASDPANDVAVLRPRFTVAPHAALSLSPRPPGLGAHVFTLGYPAPDAMGLALKMTSGEVSALAGNSHDRTDDPRLLQISVPIQSGNSGGPLIDEAGRVVGVVVSRLAAVSDDELAQNVNYALKAAYVRGLLAELPDIGGWRAVRRAGGPAELVAELKDGVFMVVVDRGDAP